MNNIIGKWNLLKDIYPLLTNIIQKTASWKQINVIYHYLDVYVYICVCHGNFKFSYPIIFLYK